MKPRIFVADKTNCTKNFSDEFSDVARRIASEIGRKLRSRNLGRQFVVMDGH